MSMEKINIDSDEVKECLHEKQFDVPKKSAKEMKEFFDSMSKKILVPKINDLVEAVNEKAESSDVYTKDEAHEQFDPRYSKLVNFEEACNNQIYITGFCYNGNSGKKCSGYFEVCCENIGYTLNIEYLAQNDTISVTYNGRTVQYIAGKHINIRPLFDINTDELEVEEDKLKFYITAFDEFYNDKFIQGHHEIHAISLGQLELSDIHKYTYPKEQVYNKTEIDLFNNGMRSEFYSKEHTYSKDEIYSKEEVNGLFKKVYTKDDVYTKDEVINLHHAMREEFYPKGNTYSRAQIHDYLNSLRTEFHPKGNVYTKDEVYSKDDVYTKEEADSLYRKTSDLLLTGYTINTPLVFMVSTQSLRNSGRFAQWVNYPLFKALVPSGEEVEIFLRLANQFSIFGGKSQIVLADDNNAPFFINGFEGYKVTSTTALGDELIKCLPPYMDLYLKYYINQTNVTGE